MRREIVIWKHHMEAQIQTHTLICIRSITFHQNNQGMSDCHAEVSHGFKRYFCPTTQISMLASHSLPKGGDEGTAISHHQTPLHPSFPFPDACFVLYCALPCSLLCYVLSSQYGQPSRPVCAMTPRDHPALTQTRSVIDAHDWALCIMETQAESHA